MIIEDGNLEFFKNLRLLFSPKALHIFYELLYLELKMFKAQKFFRYVKDVKEVQC